jgi:hypothetical protein
VGVAEHAPAQRGQDVDRPAVEDIERGGGRDERGGAGDQECGERGAQADLVHEISASSLRLGNTHGIGSAIPPREGRVDASEASGRVGRSRVYGRLLPTRRLRRHPPLAGRDETARVAGDSILKQSLSPEENAAAG